MAKNSIRDYSATAGSNTDIQSVDIDENCAASGINNAIREIMADLKDVSTGAVNLETPVADGLTIGTSNLDMNGNELILDADADTSITADTDDQVDIKIGGTDRVSISDNSISYKFSGADDTNSLILEGSNGSSEKYTFQLEANGGSSAAIFKIGSGGGTASEKARIDTSGNIGLQNGAYIGTTSSGHAITVQGGAGNPGGSIRYGGGNGDNDLRFSTNNSERMRLNNSGDLLIGSTSNVGIGKVSIDFSRVSNAGIELEVDGTAASRMLRFKNPNGTIGEIVTSGSSTTYYTSSDHRLKENVVDMTGAIARVKQLAPKRFNFIADDTVTVDGFIAHEAQTVVPEAVGGEHNEVDDDGNAVMQGIDQSKLVPLLTGALKEAITKIETLETEMTALKARVTALEA